MSSREAGPADDGIGVAMRWLTDNPEVRERATAAVKMTGKAPVDAFVSDPASLVEAVRSLVIQAVELDAPEGVVESLLPLLRPMVATLDQRDRFQYSFERIAQLEGLRDPTEVIPLIEAACADAPDALNEERLLGVLEAAARASVGAEPTMPGPVPLGCWVNCYLCTELPFGIETVTGCLVCCSLRNLFEIPDWNQQEVPKPFS